ncbi:MAG: helix-turn-helix transcriptional regulator [Ginsengibacter sp.]
MKKTIKIPRILKIKSIRGFNIYCIFNNGETRVIDFNQLFKKWKISKNDLEYLLLNEKEFKKVSLRNQTLSWKNVKIELVDIKGNKAIHPYELSPDVVYENSQPTQETKHEFFFGSIIKDARIKKGLSQQELAVLSGTSKTYISRIENNLIEPEFSTLYKIVEVGLGKKLTVEID